MPLPRSPSTSLLHNFSRETQFDRSASVKRQHALGLSMPKPKPKPIAQPIAKMQPGRLSSLGIYDLGRAKSLEWGEDSSKGKSSNESLHALSRSPVDRWGSKAMRGKMGPSKASKQARGLGLGYPSHPASSWREQLLSTMDMQVQHDSRVFAKPRERSLYDAAVAMDSQSSLTSEGIAIQAQSSLWQSQSQGQGQSQHGAMRKLNVRNSERPSKGENGKIYSFLMSRKRHPSDDGSSQDLQSSSSTPPDNDDSPAADKDKEKGKDKRKSMRLRRSTQSMDTIDDNAPTVLSSSLEKSNMLPWDRRRHFGPGLRVCAPTDSPTASVAAPLSSVRLGMTSPKGSQETYRQVPLNRSRAQSTTTSSSPPQNRAMLKQHSTASLSSEEGGLPQPASPPLKESPLSHQSSLSTSPPRPGLSFTKRAGLRSRKDLSGREAGMHRQMSTASRAAMSPEPVVYKPPTTPFDLREITSQSYYQNLTHNRRRWSHLFPTGKFSKPIPVKKQISDASSVVGSTSSPEPESYMKRQQGPVAQRGQQRDKDEATTLSAETGR